MIHSLTSDLGSFKNLEFRQGLNILLADKSPGANERQSRNGAGKTSFVELVHFMFGADVKKESIFKSDALIDYRFAVQVDIGQETLGVSRLGSRPGSIQIDRGINYASSSSMTNEQWKAFLAKEWFDLREITEPDAPRFQPSFRSLFSYFARRQQSGGFINPTRHSEQQQPWDQQISLSYLLGLDWTLASQFHELRLQERAALELRKAAKSGDLGRFFGKASDIRARLTIAEARTKRFREEIERFQVIPAYKELEQEASVLTKDIEQLVAENVADDSVIRSIQSSVSDEQLPRIDNLAKLYQEAGVVLPSAVTRRFEEVEFFHKTIIENRQAHLTAELNSAINRVEARRRKIETFDLRRQQIMNTLQNGGALEHYTNLREELGRGEAEVEGLRQRLITAERIEATKAEIDIEKANLTLALKNDLHERASIIREATLAFESLSESLYERAGILTIDDTPHGLNFDVKIDGQRSKGITNMQIFCFDFMLMELSIAKERGPRFLIHDSHLFDGVDERQIAKALQLGAQRAKDKGFQYIVTMNSDVLPTEGLHPGFKWADHIVEPRLTDATEDGGLFGLRFN